MVYLDKSDPIRDINFKEFIKHQSWDIHIQIEENFWINIFLK